MECKNAKKSKFNLVEGRLGPRDVLVGNKGKKEKKGTQKKGTKKDEKGKVIGEKRGIKGEPKEPDRQGQRSKDSTTDWDHRSQSTHPRYRQRSWREKREPGWSLEFRNLQPK